MEDLARIAEFGAEACRRAGADEAEAYVTRGSRLAIDVYQGEPEVFEKAETGGAGLRVFRGRRLGYAYTTDLSDEGIIKAAGLAYDNAAASDPDEFNGLPAGETTIAADDLGLTSPDFSKSSVQDKIDFALTMEREALGFDKRVKGCESVTYGEEDAALGIANTAGFSGSYRRQMSFGFIDAMAEDKGEVQTGFSYSAGRSLHELDAASAGREAAERASVMLGAAPMAPETLTAVFDPLVFIQIMAAITPALSAEAAQYDRSFLGSSVGRTVSSKVFELMDDGRLPKGLNSSPFDDEGTPTRRTAVISDGILRTLLYNSYAARKAGAVPTGNAMRGSFRTPPGTSPTNLYVLPGPQTKAQIIGAVDNGLYVMGLQGLHAGVSAVTGQFSAGAYGVRIRSGRLAEPVREITIATTCAELLKNVLSVGKDIRFVPMGASYGSPTVAVGGVVVSGR